MFVCVLMGCMYIFIFRERSKVEVLEEQNSKLQKLIEPYRQILEKYEAENKSSGQNDTELIQKYSKNLEQQNHKLKMKQIIKLRSDVTQLKKVNTFPTIALHFIFLVFELLLSVFLFVCFSSCNLQKNEELMVEVSKYRKNTLKGGKENKMKDKPELRKKASEVPVNATYIITSPKVNRI